ncbi:cytochrome b561 domain-containing protein [Sphingomonas parapaucimobilis]|uniref:cytochrome b561 domain-containing protein n=1 Tax=Sphingomonas parapaucimobilis TaxID=28213 RepID=UPI003918AF95
MPEWIQAMVAWAMTPLSGAGEHHIAVIVSWHARCMVVGWNILLPLGMLVARFLKIPRLSQWPHKLDQRLWWLLHVRLQVAGCAMAAIGLALILGHGRDQGAMALWHHRLGWAVMSAALLQILGGMLRGTKGGPTDRTSLRGDHYDMTLRRRIFERVHKSLGWLCLPPVWAATALGLIMVDAPRWMPVVLTIWWVAFLAVFIHLQRTGRCYDTYHAIWGDDPGHPGNSRRPIGIWVRTHPTRG